jgi:hypothetical protein
MNANLLAIAATVFAGLFSMLAAWVQRAQAQSTGAKLEAAKVTQTAAVVQTAVAQAVVDAPATQAAVADELAKGGF